MRSERGRVHHWVACVIGWLLCSTAAFAQPTLSNHLSPYLQSHADDSVRWWPPEPFRSHAARADNVPFLVSSGYLSCYWCYRFKHDTLQDMDLAGLINEAFIPVLLDREMHAEDDRLLQDFLRNSLGISGWPATAVVTPEGVPVMAWTYVSASTLRSALERFSEAWRQDPEATRQLVSHSDAAPEKGATPSEVDRTGQPTLGQLLHGFLEQASQISDTRFGGFGTDSKYPFAPQILALLDLHQLNSSDAMAVFVQHSLDSMMSGTLMDPVEGGVFRYTENRDWTEPHFEQMLYTQALMARVYFRAATALNRPEYGTVADRILDHMLARFSTRNGGFVTSLSATGEQGLNGAYYLVSERDLANLLGENWQAVVQVRQQIGDRLLVAPVGPLADVTRQALKWLRREQSPERDDKQLLSGNGLALSALSHGAFRRSEFRSAAMKLANLLMDATDRPSPGLLIGVDASDAPADLDTLVHAAAGLFDWWQVSGDAKVIARVRQLLERAVEQFHRGSGWSRATSYLLASPGDVWHIPDDQIPSPTAEWFRLTVGLRAADIPLGEKTLAIADRMAKQWTPSVDQSAFFHSTQISALVQGRFLGLY